MRLDSDKHGDNITSLPFTVEERDDTFRSRKCRDFLGGVRLDKLFYG